MKPIPQFDLSGGGFENVFNLRIESTQDGERLQREAEERERAKTEAAEQESKQQPQLI